MTFSSNHADATLRRPYRNTAVHVALTAALVFSILIAATAVSMGAARANALAVAGPDASLIVALTVASVAIIGAFSAIAARLSARARIR